MSEICRDLEVLYPPFKEKIKELLRICKEQNIPILITETFRSKERQNYLYQQGRTRSGSIITNVKYPDSYHSWYIATDFAKNVKGHEWDDKDGFFGKVGRLAEGIGLEWGGSWTGFVDKPHLQAKGMKLATLKANYGTPDKFKASWGTAAPPAGQTAALPVKSSNPARQPPENPYEAMVFYGILQNIAELKDIQYLDALISNATQKGKLDKRIDNGITEYEKSLSVLVEANIIQSPDYWRNIDNERVKKLIIDIANKCRIILEKIIMAEAGDEGEQGQVLVGNVIMNRCHDKAFPNGIYGVVFQPRQFSPIEDGAYRRAKPSVEVKNAVDRVLVGDDESHGALYFRTVAGATPDCWHERALTKTYEYRGHRFYK